MLERCANGSRGRGPRLLVAYYLADTPPPWESLNEKERRLIRTTEKAFRAELEAAGFLDPRR